MLLVPTVMSSSLASAVINTSVEAERSMVITSVTSISPCVSRISPPIFESVTCPGCKGDGVCSYLSVGKDNRPAQGCLIIKGIAHVRGDGDDQQWCARLNFERPKINRILYKVCDAM